MKNLKKIVTKANNGLTENSEKDKKNSFIFNDFLSASTSEMLNTRGGTSYSSYGPNPINGIGGDVVQGFYNMFGSYNKSAIGAFLNEITSSSVDAAKKYLNNIGPEKLAKLGGKVLGMLFTTWEAGKGSSKTDNPNYPTYTTPLPPGY